MSSLSEWVESERRPFGWFQDVEGVLYASTVRQYPGGVVVELGTYLGRSLSYILPVCKELGIRVYAVDLWGWTKSDSLKLNSPPCSLELFRVNLNRMNATDRVEIMQIDSVRAALNFSDGSVNVVMIDSKHTKEHTLCEIDVWWPKLKTGGTMLFHDYTASVRKWGVKEAVDERFRKPDMVQQWLALVKKH